MRSQLLWCTAGVFAVLASCRAAEDLVPDAGPPTCTLGSDGEDDGGAVAQLFFALKLCPRSPDAGAYLDRWNWVRLFDADGGQVPLTAECEDGDSCSGCDHRIICCRFGRVVEVRQELTERWSWSGRIRGPASLCPGTMQPCNQWLPVAPGLYTARFCFSRTLSDAGVLGPLECTERPVVVPFRNATVGTAVEL